MIEAAGRREPVELTSGKITTRIAAARGEKERRKPGFR
jgi:hypothetical protein